MEEEGGGRSRRGWRRRRSRRKKRRRGWRMSVKENGERENVESSTKKAVNRSMERRGRRRAKS